MKSDPRAFRNCYKVFRRLESTGYTVKQIDVFLREVFLSDVVDDVLEYACLEVAPLTESGLRALEEYQKVLMA